MTDSYELPLFPLQTVLFPGMPLPLHIFEPRYKLMIGQCIRDSQPFGVILIAQGSEVGSAPTTIQRIGTTAYITGARQLDNGEMDIATVGEKRFLIERTHTRNPYLTGLVRDFPVEGTEDPANPVLAAQIGAMLTRYIKILATVGEWDVNLDDLPDDPLRVAYITAMVLQMPMKDKQQLLNVPGLPALLRLERRILQREAQILKTLIERGRASLDDHAPFSAN